MEAALLCEASEIVAVRTQAALDRERSAADREQAARDRRRAARDREEAARHRREAARDRAEAARDRERAATDALTGARGRGSGLVALEHEIGRELGAATSRCSISTGLAELADGDDLQGLITRADHALRQLRHTDRRVLPR